MKTPHVQIVAARIARHNANAIIAMRDAELNDTFSLCSRNHDIVRICCERMSTAAINAICASVRLSEYNA